MMALIFAALLLAMLAAWVKWRPLSIAATLVCFGLAVWLFLYEIWSPEYGFGMPWLQV